MIEAYVLVQTEVGTALEVAQAVSSLVGVESAETVTGPYDVVVRVQVGSMDDLAPLVTVDMSGIAGIARTVTCTVMPQ